MVGDCTATVAIPIIDTPVRIELAFRLKQQRGSTALSNAFFVRLQRVTYVSDDPDVDIRPIPAPSDHQRPR